MSFRVQSLTKVLNTLKGKNEDKNKRQDKENKKSFKQILKEKQDNLSNGKDEKQKNKSQISLEEQEK